MAETLTDTSVPNPPSAELLHRVGLTREEYKRACAHTGRKLNLVEMGIFGAMWSEHCCYKSSRRLLATFPTEGKRVIQGPGENAGVMDLGHGYAVVFKIESHNHPSAVEPFQGATTGVGGIIRDIFAMGARPIGLLDSLRFGNLQAVGPVGKSPSGNVDTKVAKAEVLYEQESGPEIPWGNDPKPYVVAISWMTKDRKPLFERGPEARKAVAALRRAQDTGVEMLAYCVMPDTISFIAWIKDGGEEDANHLVVMLKAQLAAIVEHLIPQGDKPFEDGFRLHQKYDQTRLEESVMRTEYTPVQRGAVKQIKDYPYVSMVWKHGVAWPKDGALIGLPPQELPYCPGVSVEQAARNRFLLKGVVSGIAHYGNCIGIPTVGGEIAFDPSYNNNCLVNVMCVGIAKKDKLLKGIAKGVGNTALIVGAKTGRDGVQGATFASVELPEDYAKERPAVQVGDPFMEKLLLEATLEILGMDGLVGLQDFGAAGLTCSCVEMASRAGTGMTLDLDKVPQRARDLSAYEMMLSESQERMMVVVERGKEQRFIEVFKKWGLTAVPCGEVKEDKTLVVLHKGMRVAVLPNQPLAEDGPVYDRPTEVPESYLNRRQAVDSDIQGALERMAETVPLESIGGCKLSPSESKFEELLRRLLASPQIASKQPVFQQYDYMVRTNTLHPPGPSDAAVLRIKETGQGIAFSTDGSGRHMLLDPTLGGARAVLESARNVLCVGAVPLGITNCLNFGNPEKPDRMWQLVSCIEGMKTALGELDLPVTGGNVSLYNETAGASVLPTPVIGMLGLLEKATDFIQNTVNEPEIELFMMGDTDGRLDGSALLFDLGRFRGGVLADHNYIEFRECERFLALAGGEGAVLACHDVSDGGLAVALVEMCPVGVEIDLTRMKPEVYDTEELNRLGALFGEEGHRWIIAVAPDKIRWVRTAAFHFSVPLIPLGKTGGGMLKVTEGGKTWFEAKIQQLLDCHRYGLTEVMNG